MILARNRKTRVLIYTVPDLDVVLEGLELRVGERTINIPRGICRKIISYLLLRYPNPVPRSDIVGSLWPDPADEPEWSEGTAMTTIGRVRRRLRTVGMDIRSDWQRRYFLVSA